MAADGIEAGSWLKGAVATLLAGIPLVIAGLGAWFILDRGDSLQRDQGLSRRVDAVEQRLNGLSSDMAAHGSADAAQDRIADQWGRRILENERELRSISEIVAHHSDTSERCKEVTERVDKLEHRVESLTYSVRELDAGVKALNPRRHR